MAVFSFSRLAISLIVSPKPSCVLRAANPCTTRAAIGSLALEAQQDRKAQFWIRCHAAHGVFPLRRFRQNLYVRMSVKKRKAAFCQRLGYVRSDAFNVALWRDFPPIIQLFRHQVANPLAENRCCASRI